MDFIADWADYDQGRKMSLHNDGGHLRISISDIKGDGLMSLTVMPDEWVAGISSHLSRFLSEKLERENPASVFPVAS